MREDRFTQMLLKCVSSALRGGCRCWCAMNRTVMARAAGGRVASHNFTVPYINECHENVIYFLNIIDTYVARVKIMRMFWCFVTRLVMRVVCVGPICACA